MQGAKRTSNIFMAKVGPKGSRHEKVKTLRLNEKQVEYLEISCNFSIVNSKSYVLATNELEIKMSLSSVSELSCMCVCVFCDYAEVFLWENVSLVPALFPVIPHSVLSKFFHSLMPSRREPTGKSASFIQHLLPFLGKES